MEVDIPRKRVGLSMRLTDDAMESKSTKGGGKPSSQGDKAKKSHGKNSQRSGKQRGGQAVNKNGAADGNSIMANKFREALAKKKA